jgi:hypothetical protein
MVPDEHSAHRFDRVSGRKLTDYAAIAACFLFFSPLETIFSIGVSFDV